MNIGFLTPEYVSQSQIDGGLANYVYKVAHSLTDLGHRVKVFVLSDEDRTWSDREVKVIQVRRIQSRLSRFVPGLSWFYGTWLPPVDQIRSAHRLAKFVWEQHDLEPIDILQGSSYLTPGFTMTKNGHIPVVCRVSSFTPVLRAANGAKLSWAERIRDWMEMRLVVGADAAFAPSEFTRSLFAQAGAPGIDLLRTPVDSVRAEPDTALYERELSGIRYLLFFGTLCRLKGTDLLADAITPIIELDKRMHFVFVGRDDGLPGGPKIMEIVLSKNSKFAERIHYLPAIPKAQLYPVISNAIAVLLPSRADNYPNACLEAQMLGVPVIASRNSSLDEMVEDSRTGFLCENGDAASLTEAIKRLLALNEAEYRSMRKANSRVIAEIVRERRVEQLVDYYARVIRAFHRD